MELSDDIHALLKAAKEVSTVFDDRADLLSLADHLWKRSLALSVSVGRPEFTGRVAEQCNKTCNLMGLDESGEAWDLFFDVLYLCARLALRVRG